MVQSKWSRILVVAGLVVVLVSALADVLGMGEGDRIGWKQMIGIIVGIVLIGLGYYLRKSRKHTE